MIYGDVCTGIGCASAAWKSLGWRPAFFAEIAKHPSAVLKHHYPDVPNLGDFTKIEPHHHEPIDLLVGGTPCQDFSIAGLRAGVVGDRGNLTLQFLLLAQRARPRWIVWENVPGVLSSESHAAPDPCPPPDPVDLERDDGAAFTTEARQTPQAVGIGHNSASRWKVRRLTPRECDRLQGFKDDYTNVPYLGKDESADGPRYKDLGNSMAQNVMRWIGQRIEMVEAINGNADT